MVEPERSLIAAGFDQFPVGCRMNGNKSVLFFVLTLCACLASCSGSKSGGGGGGGGTSGTATLSLTLVATPLTPPPGVSLLSFTVDVTGISLKPTSGTAQSISLNSTAYSVDLTKLQSDSAFLGTSAKLPTGSYTSVTVSLSNPSLWYCVPSVPGVAGCGTGGVIQVTGGGTAPPITASLTLASNQQTGLAVNFNLANAITLSAKGVPSINLAATNVLSVSSLPSASTSLGSGQLDFVEDATGVVTAVNSSAQTVTVQTATRGSLTATANSATIYAFNCTSQTFACVQQGQVASLDTVLNAAGTLTLTEYDPLATSTGDWIEGIVSQPPSSSTQFQLVANDLVVSSSGSLIGTVASALLGAPVNVTLANPKVFTVDTKGLTVPVTSFTGTDASILLPGQTVAAHVTSFTAASGGAAAAATVDTIILRFTRVTGAVGTATSPTFSIQSLPGVFGLATPALVQLSTGSPSTNYDGVTGGTSLTTGQTVSIRALYFGSVSATPFSAAKVRVP
jgi:hypothetical protein